MGSKSRIAKYIVPIIQSHIDNYNMKNYLEPFVGGANIIDKIKCEKKYGCDINKYLIELFKNLHRLKELPEHITREHYSEVRNCYNIQSQEFEDWYIGAIGFLASYNGRFFDGGYAGIVNTKIGTTRDYYKEAYNNLYEQSENLQEIIWGCVDYIKIRPVKNYMIYCDIPYKDTKQYNTSKNFNYEQFWEWARLMSKDNVVIISECQAPEDFECIWQQELLRTVDNTKRVTSTEKLFKYSNTKCTK